MKIRRKVSLIIIIMWAMMFAVTYVEGQRLLTSSYLQIEHEEGMSDVNQVKDNVNRMLKEVSKMDAFWSIFDSAYEFMQDKNKEYIEGTVTVATLGEADIDLMLYYTTEGKYFHGLVVDPERTKEVPMPEGLSEYLTPDSKLVHLEHIDSHYEGLISTPSGIWLIASHAIVKSDSTGPLRGAQVIARRFSDTAINKISEVTKLKLNLIPIEKINEDSKASNIYKKMLSEKKDIEVFVGESEATYDGFLLLSDINSKPIAMIQVVIPRDIYQSGIKTIQYFNYIFIGFGIIFIIILSYLLRSLIISRLEKFNKNIVNIGEKKKFNLRVNEEGSDELTSLEKEANKMLGMIENYSDQQKILIKQVSNELDNVNTFSNKLKETESMLSNTINMMPSMLVITDKYCKITNLNKITEKKLGKKLDEVKGRSIFDLFPYLENYKTEIMSAMEDNTPAIIDKIVDQIKSDVSYYSVVICPLSMSSKDQNLALRIDDISENVKLEEKLRQNDKLSSIGILTASIAHEIISPINYVKSVVPTVSDNINSIISTLNNYSQATKINNDEGVAQIDERLGATIKLLDEIKNAADITDEIVKNLRSFVRMDEDVEKKFNVHDGLDSTVNILKYKCSDRVKIIKDYGVIPEIECIPGKLNQVFMNIISNAIDAIPGKGEIKIKTLQVNDILVISIKDNGVGISEENRNKIFHPFFSTKKADSGTGLGLSISVSIIEELHGTLTFRSEVGSGTEFIITIPIKSGIEINKSDTNAPKN